LPDGLFSNQKSLFGLILEGLRLENVYIFYGHLEYFMEIWDIVWPFGTFCINLVPFCPVLVLCAKKCGNPAKRDIFELSRRRLKRDASPSKFKRKSKIETMCYFYQFLICKFGLTVSSSMEAPLMWIWNIVTFIKVCVKSRCLFVFKFVLRCFLGQILMKIPVRNIGPNRNRCIPFYLNNNIPSCINAFTYS
jgi:hypothetical protein